MRNTYSSLPNPFTQTAYTKCIGFQHGVGIFASKYRIDGGWQIYANTIGYRTITPNELFKYIQTDDES